MTTENEKKEKIIQDLKEEANKVDGLLSVDDCPTLANKAKYRFGSWNEAKKVAGLEVQRKQNMTKEEVINKLQEKTEEIGRSPRRKDVSTRLWVQCRKLFGGWNEAKESAGLETYENSWANKFNPRGRDYPDEEILEVVRKNGRAMWEYDLAEELGYECKQIAFRIRQLHPVLKRCKLRAGSTQGGAKTANEVFKRLRGKKGVACYMDVKSLVDFIEKDFILCELSPALSRTTKTRITQIMSGLVPRGVVKALKSRYTNCEVPEGKYCPSCGRELEGRVCLNCNIRFEREETEIETGKGDKT